MKDKNLEDTTLTLFFTGGVGLKTWVDVGNLDRELEVYKRLSHALKRVNFVSYGGSQDKTLANHLGDIRLLPTGWYGRREFTILNLLRKHWREILKTDILKTNQIPGSEIPLWLKQRLGKKLIVRCGYLYSFFVKNQTQDEKKIKDAMELEGKAFSAADAGIVTSAWQRDIVIKQYGVEPAKIRVIPNYVVTDVFKPRPEMGKKCDLVFVGRAGNQKNIDNLLDALDRLKTKGRNISLLMIGGCCEDSQLRKMVSDYALDVAFAGNVPNFDLPPLLNQARAFIQPSLYEGHPKTLLEAMSCGLPCIGTDVTGIREDIEHRVTGYLCKTDCESIASAIETVLSDSLLQKTMGENAREYIVRNYSIDRVFQMELEVIKEVIAR
jgi:glycosyltransferase involved in cell wall biosynthesis